MDGLNKKLQVDIYSNVEIGVGLGNVLKTVLNQEDVSISTFLFFKFQCCELNMLQSFSEVSSYVLPYHFLNIVK